MLIDGNIVGIMRFQGDQHLMFLCIIDHFIHQKFCQSMVLVARIHCQVNYMKPFGLMKLVRPAGIQVILSLNEIPEGLQAGILFDQPAICGKHGLRLCEAVLQEIIMLCFIRNHQNTVQFTAVGIDLTGVKKLRQIAGKKLREKPFSGIVIRDQCMI